MDGRCERRQIHREACVRSGVCTRMMLGCLVGLVCTRGVVTCRIYSQVQVDIRVPGMTCLCFAEPRLSPLSLSHDRNSHPHTRTPVSLAVLPPLPHCTWVSSHYVYTIDPTSYTKHRGLRTVAALIQFDQAQQSQSQHGVMLRCLNVSDHRPSPHLIPISPFARLPGQQSLILDVLAPRVTRTQTHMRKQPRTPC